MILEISAYIFLTVYLYQANSCSRTSSMKDKPSSGFDGHGGDILLPYLWAVPPGDLSPFSVTLRKSETLGPGIALCVCVCVWHKCVCVCFALKQ